ncbi:MAG: glycosyltransferase family 4 protein [Roseobacter sp.]|jgi:glycosyltransferase involved in cell wall biosynthesis
MTSAVKPKVLIVAPNVSSRFGGEAFLPLKYFQIMKARDYPVKLVTHARNRQDLMQMFAPYLEDIILIDDTFWHKMVWNVGRIFPGRVAENLTQILLDRIDTLYQTGPIRQLIAEGQVDLIHQPIPVSPLSPSSLYKYGKPLVIGPMNGDINFPPGYRDYEKPFEALLLNLARRFAPLINRLSPGKHQARTLLVANPRTREAISFLDHPHVVQLVENGVDLQLFEEPAPHRPGAPGRLRLVYMGRMPRWKALDITLEAVAIARSKGVDVALDILGDGAQRKKLEKQTRSLGLEGQITFHGFVPQHRCAEVLHGSDALILNSLRECGGAVVLEAMSMGLPVIAADWGGPADYVDPECGILVHPVPRDSFAARLADAMVRLADDTALRAKMGQAGIRRIHADFDWEKKVDTMLGIYADAVRGERAVSAAPRDDS